MAGKWEELRPAAQQANCTDRIDDLEHRIEALKAQREIQLAVIGERVSGKTQLLNRMVGQTLREPSVLPAEGPPLRVVFNRQQPRSGFEQIEVFAPEWDDAGVALHAFSTDGVCGDEMVKLFPDMELIDVVVYVMSVTMPLTETDRKLIGMVAPRPVILVLTKTDLVSEEILEKLVQLVQNFCREEGVALMTVLLPDREQDVGKTVRDLLAQLDVAALRDERIAAWTAQAQDAMRAPEREQPWKD